MRVNNGLTPQELEAYGISDVHDIVYNPSYDLLYHCLLYTSDAADE